MAMAFRKFRSWETTRIVEGHVWGVKGQQAQFGRAVCSQPPGILQADFPQTYSSTYRHSPAGNSPAIGWLLHLACLWVLEKGTHLGLKGWRTRNLGVATFPTLKLGCSISNSPSNSRRSGLWKRRMQSLRSEVRDSLQTPKCQGLSSTGSTHRPRRLT